MGFKLSERSMGVLSTVDEKLQKNNIRFIRNISN